MNLFLRISIVLTILTVFGASISGVLHQKARQEKINKALIQLTSKDQDERANAINALTKLNAKETIPEITRLLQDNDSAVRRSATWALVRLDAKEAIPEITKLLQDNDPKVRSAARAALKALGVEVPAEK